MSREEHWLGRRMGWGLALTFLGVLVLAGGLLLQVLTTDLPFDPRIISGLGILFFGIGVAQLVQSVTLCRDPEAARRARIEVKDERTALLRARAGSRAYVISAGLTYALLMWESFASNGSLPMLSRDALWFVLAGIVVLPLAVYIGSLVRDQQRS